MAISKKDVEKIAELARLDLSPVEIDLYQKQLSSILDYVNMLQEVNTENVEPTSQVTGLQNVVREDKEGLCLKSDEVLSNAPEHESKSFKVNKIIE